MRRLLVAIGLCAGLGGCASTDLGLIFDALPPAQALGSSDSGRPSAANLNPIRYGNPRSRISGEHQVDTYALLLAATDPDPPNPVAGAHTLGVSATATEADFAILIDRMERNTSDTRKAQVRNELVGQLVQTSIDNCSVFLKSIRGSQVASRTFFDVMTGGLTTAGAVASPERTARLLAALGSFSNGAGASVDRDVFAERGVEVVAQEIERVRGDLHTAIELKKRGSYSEWDLGAAMADVAKFHSECSMLRGLAHVQDAVAMRDADLKTARQVAAKVLAAGGNAEQVNAALSGVVEAAIAADTSGAFRVLGPGPPPLDSDVHDLVDKALSCLSWAKDYLSQNKDKTESALASVAEYNSDCRSQTDPFVAKFFNPTKDALDKNATLGASAAEFGKTFDALSADVRSKLGVVAQQVIDRRTRTWLAASSMAATETDGAATQTEIRSTSNSTQDTNGKVANPDPALLAAAAASSGLDGAKTTPGAVAGAAQGALVGYLRNYTPLSVRRPPPAPAAPPPSAKGGG